MRFKTVNASDLLRDTFHKTGRDQEALEYYLSSERLEEAERYVEIPDTGRFSSLWAFYTLQVSLDRYVLPSPIPSPGFFCQSAQPGA